MHSSKSLKLFHPLIASWFEQEVGSPTEIQEMVWPVIFQNEHVLLSAPTGSGKTMSAFLCFLDHFITGKWNPGHTQVLYISPLKALNNDIRINLLTPLLELASHFKKHNESFPEIRVMTRSGDTTPNDRQKMLRKPPEILITTPESLNLLLSSQRGMAMLSSVRALILDEIHAIAQNKRGVHLMTAVERLAVISGEFQRIALSATVRPMERVAEFIGGYEMKSQSGKVSYTARRIRILKSEKPKLYRLSIELPESKNSNKGKFEKSSEDMHWLLVAAKLRQIIKKNRTTLIFVNSRALAESLTKEINFGLEKTLALCHHGSLSKELRLEAERRLKAGLLPAIVATGTLELGIDIGSVDKVILIQSPFSVSSGLQRIGRAGHGVGDISYADFFPSHERDLLSAVVMKQLVINADIEDINPLKGTLDVLAQILVSMAVASGPDGMELEQMYNTVRCSSIFHELDQINFNLVIAMLTGHYSTTRVHELKARILFDESGKRIRASDGSRLILFMSGGTIPNRGYYDLRLQNDNAKIGELDEEFVWERILGDVILFGNRLWRIEQINHNDVLVTTTQSSKDIVHPFWRADQRNSDWHLAKKTGELLEFSQKLFESSPDESQNIDKIISQKCAIDSNISKSLIHYFQKQIKITNTALPNRKHIVFERIIGKDSRQAQKVILMNFWGGKTNQPLSLVLKAAWKRKYGSSMAVAHNNDGILMILPIDFDPVDVLKLFEVEEIPGLLRSELENSGLFGALFRENAGRALLLPPRGFNNRLPLWFTRQRAKNLLEAVREFDDFPIQIETWRNCLQDEFEMPELENRLREIQEGEIKISFTKTRDGSPFASDLLYSFTDSMMYADDTPARNSKSNLDSGLLDRILAGSTFLQFNEPEVLELEQKLKRTWPGYAPTSTDSFEQLILDRVFLNLDDWKEIIMAMIQDLQTDNSDFLNSEDQDKNVSNQEAVIQKLHQLLQPLNNKIFLIKWIKQPGRSLFLHQNNVKWFLRWLNLIPEADSNLEIFMIDFDFLMSLNKDWLSKNSKDQIQELQFCLDSQSNSVTLENNKFDCEKNNARFDLNPVHGFANLLDQALYFHGPIELSEFAGQVGLIDYKSNPVITKLLLSKKILTGKFLAKNNSKTLCYSENYQRLLRILRKSKRANIPVLDKTELSLFLAEFQGLGKNMQNKSKSDKESNTLESLENSLEQLMGYPGIAELWELAFLPTRVSQYKASMLDELMTNSSLQWFGSGKQKILFSFFEDRRIFGSAKEAFSTSEVVAKKLPTNLSVLQSNKEKQNHSIQEKSQANEDTELLQNKLSDAWFSETDILNQYSNEPGKGKINLWNDVWSGKLISQGFIAIRQGIKQGFGKIKTITNDANSIHGSRSRWRSNKIVNSLWRNYNFANELSFQNDPIQNQILLRNRIRQLFRRYGILFRQILAYEMPELHWRCIFSELRLMELGGEIQGGYFISGLSGLQFASHEAVIILENGLNARRIYWLNATDPISICGVFPGNKQRGLATRRKNNWLVYHGTQIVLTINSNGKRLVIHCDEDDSNISEYFKIFKIILNVLKTTKNMHRLQIEKINDEPARLSPWKKNLLDFGFEDDGKNLVLWKDN